MAQVSNVKAVILERLPFTYPYPLALWRAYSSKTGDASGGMTRVNISFKGIVEPGQWVVLDKIELYNDDGTSNASLFIEKYSANGSWQDLDTSFSTEIKSISYLTLYGINGQLVPQSRSGLPLVVGKYGAAGSLGDPGDLNLSLRNIDGKINQLYAFGLIYSYYPVLGAIPFGG